MKRLIGALGVGTLVFGAVIASAANLNVDAGVIQVGTDGVVECDTDGVSVVWNANYEGIVTSAQVSGVNDVACDGQTLYLYALDAADDIIGAPHSPSIDCGAPGTPLTVAPQAITSGTTTYKIALGYVNPADNQLSSPTYPCGVPGQFIDGVRVVIGV